MNLYKLMVRPHLEYCYAAWGPHYTKDKQMLEKAQHRFTRMFPRLKNLSYEDRLSELGLRSLEERRNRADIIEVFKMVKQLSSVPWNRFFKRAEDSVTRGHSWKLMKESCHRDCSRVSTPWFPEPRGAGDPGHFSTPKPRGFWAFKPRSFGVEKFPVAELKKQ